MATQFEQRIMARVSLVITSLIVLLPAICNAEGPDPECEDGVIIGTLATPFVEFVNGYRKKLIEGTQNNGKNQDALPEALNVKEVEWDCELEEALQWDVNWHLCRHNEQAAYEPSSDVADKHSCVHYAFRDCL